jgi:hypothetical protein
MPRLLRVQLSPEQQAERRRRLHERDLAPHTRIRPECVRLSGKKMTVPPVAALAQTHPATVRATLERFAAGGWQALVDTPRCGRPPRLPRADRDAAEAMLDACTAGGPPWTAPQRADWLQAAGRAHLPVTTDEAVAHRRVWPDSGHPAPGRSRPLAGRPGPSACRLAAASRGRPDRGVLPGRAGAPRPGPPAPPGRGRASAR